MGSNIINSNAAISSCQWQLAYQLLNEVTLMFCRPTVITWNSIISCLSKATEWQRFFKIFADMTSKNVTPDIISYNTSISGISGIGGIREESDQWHLALHFLNEATFMLNLQATVISYNATITSCTFQWPLSLELVERMQEMCFEANLITWNLGNL